MTSTPTPSSGEAARLAASGWDPPIKFLCRRAGPLCKCGAYSYRTRREPTPDRPHLMRVRCEGCGTLDLLDPADPGANLAEVGGQALACEQAALF